MSSIPVQVAVKNAKRSLLELYADDPPKAVALEEIEFVKDDDRSLWSVTLGFYRPKSVSAMPSSGALGSIFLQPAVQIENRVYKTVFIDANTGDFVKMDMRQVQ